MCTVCPRSLVHILLSYSVTVWTHITANLDGLSKREKGAQADAVQICGNILYVQEVVTHFI